VWVCLIVSNTAPEHEKTIPYKPPTWSHDCLYYQEYASHVFSVLTNDITGPPVPSNIFDLYSNSYCPCHCIVVPMATMAALLLPKRIAILLMWLSSKPNPRLGRDMIIYHNIY
jgi:hypothetical protein